MHRLADRLSIKKRQQIVVTELPLLLLRLGDKSLEPAKMQSPSQHRRASIIRPDHLDQLTTFGNEDDKILARINIDIEECGGQQRQPIVARSHVHRADDHGDATGSEIEIHADLHANEAICMANASG